MQKFLLYLPYSDFIDYYQHKALGAIPIGFEQAGFDVSLIVGIMRSQNYRENKIRIYETGNLDDRYVKTGKSDRMAIKPRLLNFLNISEYKKVLRILKKENPDILMSYNNSTLTWLIMWRYRIYCRTKNVKTRLILKLDNDGSDLMGMKGIRKMAIRLYYKLLSSIFNDIITETTCGYEVFSNLPGLKTKLRVVPNTVFDDFLKHSNKERSKTIIAVSRIAPVKGLDILIKSFKLIAERYPDWNLEIIGAVGDMEYFSSLKELTGPSFLGRRIVFTGEKTMEELIDIYGRSSIYCLFSEHESFAISRLEAIAMGLYVITTPAGCANSLIKYGVHILKDSTPECGSKYLEEGIKATESGAFKGNYTEIPTYKDIAIQIAGIAENNNI